MVKVVSGYQHRPGLHCGSTALRNIMAHHGWDLSEAACFGLGAGLDFVYLRPAPPAPSRYIGGRCPDLEDNFHAHLGLPFYWHRPGTPSQAWNGVKEWLDRDVPVLLRTDLYHLEYYQSKTHFSGHSVVLAGYDEEAGIAYLSDTEREGLQVTSLDSLARARQSDHLPLPVHNDYHPATRPAGTRSLSEAMRRALATNSRRMLAPDDDRSGLKAMERFAADLDTWAVLPDRDWCLRFAYQVIERRGTGGGAFRRMYAEFLAEAEDVLPELVTAPCTRLSREMGAIAQLWTELGRLFRSLSEGDHFPGYRRAAGLLSEIARRERAVFERLQHR